MAVFTLGIGLPVWVGVEMEQVLTNVVHLVKVQLWYTILWLERLFLHGTEEDLDAFIFGLSNGLVEVCDKSYRVVIALEDI